MKSWKTTGLGIMGFISIAYNFYTTKTFGPDDMAQASICFGLLFAKDHNVSGK